MTPAAKPSSRKASQKRASPRKAPAKRTAPARTTDAGKGPRLLTGGNPQIPKGDGDAPVQAYIAAMPEWKSDVGRRLDGIIVRTVPRLRKAVRWNSAFYGVEGQGFFLNFSCFTRYVKVAFFRGAELRPLPPGKSKHAYTRYLDIHEDGFDEEQFAKWVRQAAAIPGWDGGSPANGGILM